MIPQIVIPDLKGYHNTSPDTGARLEKTCAYRDLSTVIICPTRGQISAKVVQAWMGMMRPMNQKVVGPIFAVGMEVGAAYNFLVECILNNPELSTWKYILTIEEDNMPPPDGLLRLYEAINGDYDGKRFDVVGGLYWTKGEGGQPMIYGNPLVVPKNFMPQPPIPETTQECNGLGMGFNLFRLDTFRNLEKPWFRTLQQFDRAGGKCYTQDLYFFEQAAKKGLRFACDTRVRVGHYDYEGDRIW